MMDKKEYKTEIERIEKLKLDLIVAAKADRAITIMDEVEVYRGDKISDGFNSIIITKLYPGIKFGCEEICLVAMGPELTKAGSKRKDERTARIYIQSKCDFKLIKG